MKKICMFLFITCVISVHSMEARSAVEILNEPAQTTYNINQSDSEVLINILENLGFEIEKLEVLADGDEKECTITIKGTYKGEEIDVTITIKGQTCGEILKELM